MNGQLDWKDDVTLETYGSLDPWDPNTSKISKTYNQSLLLNLRVQVYTHNNKCDLIHETYHSMCYVVNLLQEFFKYVAADMQNFLSCDNMVKYLKVFLHSLKHVNINFIHKFCEWLDIQSIPIGVRLFRMLGIFVQYLVSPTIFEAIVPTESRKTLVTFPSDFKLNLDNLENK